MEDNYVYSVENVRSQLASAPKRLGYYELRFYALNGRPAKHPTESVETFYYYPSGGTIRDKDMNIIFYEPKLDSYRSFKTGL
jgi:hypothetical protein